jgi:hypothetical protein
MHVSFVFWLFVMTMMMKNYWICGLRLRNVQNLAKSELVQTEEALKELD